MFCLSPHLATDAWAVPALWPPWRMMLGTRARAYRFRPTALDSGAHDPGLGLLAHTAGLCVSIFSLC